MGRRTKTKRARSSSRVDNSATEVKEHAKKLKASNQIEEEEPAKKVEASNQMEEEPVKKVEASNQTEEMKEMKDVLAVLECPVCLDDIQKPPIYICENPQGHSVCAKCHKSLKIERKPCAVCRQPLADRRNLGLEKVLEALLLLKCRFKDCSFKASTRAAMQKHEEDWHRQVPCAWCNDMIGMESLEKHLNKEHGRSQLHYRSFSKVTQVYISKMSSKEFKIMAAQGQDDYPKFLWNMATTFNEGAKVFWMTYLGPKDLAETFKYTLQVRASNTSKKYLLEGTRVCEPCDVTHQEMLRELSGIIVNKRVFQKAADGDEDNKLYVHFTLQKEELINPFASSATQKEKVCGKMGKRSKNKKVRSSSAGGSIKSATEAQEHVQKVEASIQTEEEEPVEKEEASNQTEEMNDVLAVLECPVCLDDIQKTPIYICENTQGHSVCAKCHKSLKNERKPCPVCSQPLANRRSLGLENLLEALLQKCRFKDCSFKASTRAAMEKHEEDWHRPVPCAWCDDMIGMESLEEHLTKEHSRNQLHYRGLSKMAPGIRIPKTSSKEFIILAVQGRDDYPKFLWNMATLNGGHGGAKVFWMTYLGPEDLAETFKYTFQIKASKSSQKYLQEGTLVCEPCDLTHQEMKRELSGFIVSQKVFQKAAEGDEDNRLHIDLLIQKV